MNFFQVNKLSKFQLSEVTDLMHFYSQDIYFYFYDFLSNFHKCYKKMSIRRIFRGKLSLLTMYLYNKQESLEYLIISI